MWIGDTDADAIKGVTTCNQPLVERGQKGRITGLDQFHQSG